MAEAPAQAQQQQLFNPRTIVDPKALRVLVVDSKNASREAVVRLLRDYSYQVLLGGRG